MPPCAFRHVLIGGLVRRDRRLQLAAVPVAAAGNHQRLTARLLARTQTVGRIFDLPKVPHRPGPVARVHTPPDPLAVELAVTPNRAAALGEASPFLSMRAGLQVAAPES